MHSEWRIFPIQEVAVLSKRKILIYFAAVGVTACAGSPELDRDKTLERNLAQMANRPGATQLNWRQPKERVPGAAVIADVAPSRSFPAQEALNRALRYSKARQGRGIMVWYDGDVVAENFDDGISANTPFAAYSMHKTVLSLVLLAAIEDGYVDSLDTPVGQYLSKWRNDERGNITLRDLLTHTSGLAHYGVQTRQAQMINFSGRMRDAALSYPLVKSPGTEFQYNNVNSLVLGIALSQALQAHGLHYASYLGKRLWRPMGNRDAKLWRDSLEQDGVPRFHSGLEAGLADWLNVGVMLVNRGVTANKTRVLSNESIDNLTTPSAINPAYGLHLWLGLGDQWQPRRSYGPNSALGAIHSEPFLADDVWFLDGFGGQRVYAVPSASLVVARFGEIDFEYDDAAIVNMLLRGLSNSEHAGSQPKPLH